MLVSYNFGMSYAEIDTQLSWLLKLSFSEYIILEKSPVPAFVNGGPSWQMLKVLFIVLCSVVLWAQMKLVVEPMPWWTVKSHSPPPDAPFMAGSVETMFNGVVLNI